MEKIKVGVMGALGKMGKEVCRAVLGDEALTLTAAYALEQQGMDIGPLIGLAECGVKVETNLTKMLEEADIDVMVDFTNAQAVLDNLPRVIAKGIHVVVGTTGLTQEEVQSLGKQAEEAQVGMFIASNFAIGAVLMMKFAQEAAKYMPNVEIIELHHDHKLDAPSGTAVTTLKKIAQSRQAFAQGAPNEYEKIAGSRGGEYEGMHVHSVRLPGYVAHQEVIFGGLGQTLTIRHDSISRESFMPGVLRAVKKVSGWTGLVEDLESIMA